MAVLSLKFKNKNYNNTFPLNMNAFTSSCKPTLYIFVCRATGIRILHSFLFLLASGMLGKEYKVVPILFDLDIANKSFAETIELLEQYKLFHKLIQNNGSLCDIAFGTEVDYVRLQLPSLIKKMDEDTRIIDLLLSLDAVSPLNSSLLGEHIKFGNSKYELNDHLKTKICIRELFKTEHLKQILDLFDNRKGDKIAIISSSLDSFSTIISTEIIKGLSKYSDNTPRNLPIAHVCSGGTYTFINDFANERAVRSSKDYLNFVSITNLNDQVKATYYIDFNKNIRVVEPNNLETFFCTNDFFSSIALLNYLKEPIDSVRKHYSLNTPFTHNKEYYTFDNLNEILGETNAIKSFFNIAIFVKGVNHLIHTRNKDGSHHPIAEKIFNQRDFSNALQRFCFLFKNFCDCLECSEDNVPLKLFDLSDNAFDKVIKGKDLYNEKSLIFIKIRKPLFSYNDFKDTVLEQYSMINKPYIKEEEKILISLLLATNNIYKIIASCELT